MKKLLKLCTAALAVVFTLCMIGNNKGTDVVHAETGDVAINETNFPDEKFRDYIKTQIMQDQTATTLTQEKINQTTQIECASLGIQDLTGISYFSKLEYLLCSDNLLTSLDLSENTPLQTLICSNNQISSLTLSGNTNLTYLRCSRNKLASLTLSLQSLTTLECHSNSIANLDVKGCTSLTDLNCDSNNLTELDISHNTALTNLSCNDNKISNFDLSSHTNPIYVSCRENGMKSIKLSSAVASLSCGYNKLTSLDVSGAINLIALDCEENQIKELNLSKNSSLIRLSCTDNGMETLILPKNNTPLLTDINCSRNNIKSLDFSGCIKIETLYCSDNALTSLDLSNNAEIKDLSCVGNNIETIKLADTDKLTKLFVYKNKLTHMPDGNYSNVPNFSGKFKGDEQTPVTSFYIENGKYTVALKALIGDGKLACLSVTDTNWDYNSGTGLATYKGSGIPKSVGLSYTFGNNNLELGITASLEAKYEPTEATTAEYIPGSGQPLTFTFKRGQYDDMTFEMFQELRINGQVVPEKYYTTSKGSLKITLLSDYLDSLEGGDYTLEVYFKDGGTATAAFTVASKEANDVTVTTSPPTGDAFSVSLWTMMLLVSGLAVTFIRKRIHR